MAVRNEAVRLSLEDDFTTGVAKAAAVTALLSRELNDLSGQSVTTARATRAMSDETDRVAKSANRADSSINQLSGRLGLLVKAAAILGPALVPLGGIGLAGVAGLANQLGAAAVAGGVAALAFQGIGKTLQAVNKAQLEPTAKNIIAARKALEDLSPAAQDLVVKLETLKPVLSHLRDVAAEGLMPGILESIDELQTRLPDVQRILESVSHATGDLVAQAGAGLAGPSFDDFFTFLATEVPGTLMDVGAAAGSLTHGLAEMWMAFDPLNDDFSNWMVDAADKFDRFATGLSGTQGFSEFIDYVRQNGPQVADTAGAIANALIQIAEAAAPIGGPVLHGIEILANTLAKVADSDLGTPIMAAVAAMSALSLATKGYENLVTTKIGGRAKSSITGMVDALTTVTSAQDRARLSSAQLAEVEAKRAATVREGAATIGKTAALLGGVALATSGAADSMGLANTATLALMGTIGGPYGAAAGAAIGFGIDLAKVNNDFADSVDRANRVLADSPAEFGAQQDAINATIQAYNDFYDAANPQGGFFSGFTDVFTGNTAAIKNTIEDIFGTSEITDQKQALDELQASQASIIDTWHRVDDALGRASGIDSSVASLDDLQGMANRIKPAMDALGITFKDLQNASPAVFRSYVDAIKDYNKTTDSVPGRTLAFVKSLHGLHDSMLSTKDSADELNNALENLLGPGLNAEEATDGFRKALKDLDKEMAGQVRTFKGFSDAALEWRDRTRGIADDIVNVLTTQAANGAGPRAIVTRLQDMREAFIKEGIAVGFTRKEMEARARTLGLTPKLVRTVFQSVGLTLQQAKIRDLVDDLQKLPKSVRTELKTAGYDLSKKQVNDLAKRYDLTPEQVDTIMQATDKASAVIAEINRRADALDHRKTDPNITAHDAASTVIDRVIAKMNNLDGKVSTSYIRTIEIHSIQTHHISDAQGRADGAVVDYYSGGGMRENHIAQVAPAGSWRVWAEPETGGEAYIPLANDWRRPRAADVWRETGKRIGMAWMEYARGGLNVQPVPSAATPSVVSAPAPQVAPVVGLSDRDVQRIAAAVRTGSREGTAKGMKVLTHAITAEESF